MTTFTTRLETIDANNFDPRMREMLIQEAQRTHFTGSLPDGFAFLRGAFVDLGFQHLGLDDHELRKVRLAFVGTGVAIPGRTYRLRNARSLLSVVEPADGSEQATLPVHWRQGVLVLGHDDRHNWIGKGVPGEWIAGVDLTAYADAGDGWSLLPASRPD